MPTNRSDRSLTGNGNVKNVRIGALTNMSNLHSSNHPICPFTPFVPMQYLSRAGMSIRAEIEPNVPTLSQMNGMFGERQMDLSMHAPEKVVQNKQGMIKAKEAAVLYRLISATNCNKPQLYILVDQLLGFDAPQAFNNQVTIISNNTRRMHEVFSLWESHTYTLRSCRGSIGNFHITTVSETGESTFHILPVILPQNLYYQRLHLLLHGTVDLEYVIFLVNEELEHTAFPIKGLRTMYVGRLRKILLETAGEVVFVPQGFIEENCFIPTFKITARKPLQRKLEKDSIVRMFLNSVKFGSNTLDWSLYYDPTKNAPPPPVYTGPLVPPVESTSIVDDRMAELVPQGRATVAINLADGLLTAGQEQLLQMTGMLNEMRDEMLGIPPERVGNFRPLSDLLGPHENMGMEVAAEDQGVAPIGTVLHPMDDIEGGRHQGPGEEEIVYEGDDDLDQDEELTEAEVTHVQRSVEAELLAPQQEDLPW